LIFSPFDARRDTLPLFQKAEGTMTTLTGATPARSIFQSPVLALTLAALFWSGNFVAGRALRGHVDPLTLNFVRWLLALAIMTPFVWRSMTAHRRVIAREWRLVIALGATGIASFHTLVYLALQTTTASNALLMLSLAPILTILGSGLTGTERLTPGQIAGALISIAGAGVLITRGHIAETFAHGFNTGDLWMLLAVVIWAAYSVILRRRPADLPSAVTLTASMVAALAMMAPLLLWTPTPAAALGSVPVLLSIAYIALFASAIAFLLWSYGVSELGPARAGQFVHLMPIFGAALAFVLLGEALTPVQIAGAILVLAGIAVVEHRPPARRVTT
jgi:drug/metabolite transporter (DMT)-like permease